MSTILQYFPPVGDALNFTTGTGAAFRIQRVEGLEPVQATPILIKSPNQPGSTAVDVSIPGRVVTVSGIIHDNDDQGLNFPAGEGNSLLWYNRSLMTRALAQQPTRLGEDITLGRLRFAPAGQQPLEVVCIPRSVSISRPAATQDWALFDIEFFAPDPYWRETADTEILFTAAGGFEWSLEFSLEMPSNNVEVEIDYLGDVDAPILATLEGDITTARLKNLTYSETLEIEGNLPATKQWEVSTEFGNKYIDEITISGGARVNALDKIDLNLADFWVLRPGINVVKFEADVNVSGSAKIVYRSRFSGF